MATSDERREVAQELRALDMSDIEVDGCIIDSPKYVGLLLMRMLDAACDYRGGLHYFPGFFSAQAVVELFADLIDPTTTVDETGVETVADAVHLCECNECGHSFEWVYGEYEFCPRCGARVVSETATREPYCGTAELVTSAVGRVTDGLRGEGGEGR